MIKKEDLRDWLAEGDRKEHKKKIENYIDKEIKRNALNGVTTFTISTGRFGERSPETTNFHPLWCPKKDELSQENVSIVRRSIIDAYRTEGFSVQVVEVDCGWHTFRPALKFENIHKALETKEDE